MLVALNIASLLLVVALAWAGVWWFSHRVHRRSRHALERRPGAHDCEVCQGLGATRRLGRIEPCPRCQGTGVRAH